MTEEQRLREENHNLNLALKTVEINLDKLLTENKSLKLAFKEKDQATADLKTALTDAHSKILEAKAEGAAIDRRCQAQITELQSALRTREKEAVFLTAKLKTVQEASDNDVERIKIRHAIETKFKDEIAVLQAQVKSLETSLLKRTSEADKISKQSDLGVVKYEAALKDLKTRHKRELDELRMQLEKAESEADEAKRKALERDSEAKRMLGEQKVRFDFAESELKRMQQHTSGFTQEKTDTFLKYNDILDKIKDEKRTLQAEFDKIQIEKVFADNELALKRNVFEKLEKQLGNLLKEREVLASELARKDEQLADLTTRLRAAESDHNSAFSALNCKAEEKASLLRQQLERERTRNQDLELQTEKLKKEVAENTRSTEETETRLSERCRKLVSELERLSQSQETAQTRLRELELEHHKAKIELQTVTRQLVEKEKELEKSKKQNEETLHDAKIYLDSLGRLKHTDSLQQKAERYKIKFEKCKQKLDQANKKLVELLLEKKNFWNPGPPLHSPNTVNYGYAPLDHHILQDTTWNEPYQPKYAHLIAGQGPQGAYSQARNERGTKYNPNYLEQNTDHNPNQDFGRVNDNGRTELLGTFKSGMSGLSHPRSKSFGTRMHVQQNVDLNSDPYYYEPQVQEETEWPQEIYIEPNEPKQALPLNPEHEFILEKDNYNHLSTEERIRELILNGDRMFNVK